MKNLIIQFVKLIIVISAFIIMMFYKEFNYITITLLWIALSIEQNTKK